MNIRIGLMLAAVLGSAALMRGADAIDFNRARQLMQKQKGGQALTADERDYLERARAARGQQKQKGSAPESARSAPAAPPREQFATTPLPERAAADTYRGESGGLYGDGRNEPPPAQLAAALAAAKKIVPLDRDGRPSPDGKIVLLSIGMSNTTQEFRRFKELADADSAKSPRVVVVDGAQGGQDARITADPKAAYWAQVDARLKGAGATASQVQAVWLKQAIAQPKGGFPAAAKQLQDYMGEIVRTIKARYPNAQLCYISNRTYAGYALTTLNPEPYAFESAFSVRWLIADQIRGAPELNADPARGPVKAPVLLWGPYLWASGTTPRRDGFRWERGDSTERDGTHPSASGQQKVAELLLAFFKKDSTARSWFVAAPAR